MACDGLLRLGIPLAIAPLGVNYHRWEVYAGYDYYDVGGTHTNGLVSGIRFWY